MADNTLQNGTDTIATDDIGGVKYQRMKVTFGVDGVSSDVSSVAPLPTADSSDMEFTALSLNVTAAGDTTIYTPATGKRVRLRWVYAINDPSSATPARITIKLGGVVKYIVYGLSKRQVDTGPIDGALVINLSQAGNVACTFRIEEI